MSDLNLRGEITLDAKPAEKALQEVAQSSASMGAIAQKNVGVFNSSLERLQANLKDAQARLDKLNATKPAQDRFAQMKAGNDALKNSDPAKLNEQQLKAIARGMQAQDRQWAAMQKSTASEVFKYKESIEIKETAEKEKSIKDEASMRERSLRDESALQDRIARENFSVAVQNIRNEEIERKRAFQEAAALNKRLLQGQGMSMLKDGAMDAAGSGLAGLGGAGTALAASGSLVGPIGAALGLAAGALTGGISMLVSGIGTAFSAGLSFLKSVVTTVINTIGNVISSGWNLAKSLGSGALVAGGVAAAGAVAGTVHSVKVASDYEQTSIAMSTMLGDEQKADALLKEIRSFANSTPFEFPEIAKASREMLAFGFNSKDVVGDLRMLGDVAAGIGAPIGEIAEVFGKAKTEGRLYARTIEEFTRRGIPIITELAKVMGVSEQQVRGLCESGELNFPQLQQAFQNMTKSGGQFSGMLEKQSKSAQGLWSTLKDLFTDSAREFGTQLLGPIKDGLKTLKTEMQKFATLGGAAKFGKEIAVGMKDVMKSIQTLGPDVMRTFREIVGWSGWGELSTRLGGLVSTIFDTGILQKFGVGLVETIKTGVTALTDGISNVTDMIANGTFIESMLYFAKYAFTVVSGALTTAAWVFGGVLSDVIARTDWEKVGTGLIQTLKGVGEYITSILMESFKNATAGIMGFFNAMQSRFADAGKLMDSYDGANYISQMHAGLSAMSIIARGKTSDSSVFENSAIGGPQDLALANELRAKYVTQQADDKADDDYNNRGFFGYLLRSKSSAETTIPDSNSIGYNVQQAHDNLKYATQDMRDSANENLSYGPANLSAGIKSMNLGNLPTDFANNYSNVQESHRYQQLQDEQRQSYNDFQNAIGPDQDGNSPFQYSFQDEVKKADRMQDKDSSSTGEKLSGVLEKIEKNTSLLKDLTKAEPLG